MTALSFPAAAMTNQGRGRARTSLLYPALFAAQKGKKGCGCRTNNKGEKWSAPSPDRRVLLLADVIVAGRGRGHRAHNLAAVERGDAFRALMLVKFRCISLEGLTRCIDLQTMHV